MEKSQKRNLALIIIFAAVFVIAAGVAVYFLMGATRAEEAIAEIDSTEYTSVAMDKGAQYTLKGQPLTANIEESLEDTVYNTPLGFPIISYSANWTGDKLIEIYDELLRNKHGDEIRYITKIELFPGEAEYSEYFSAAGDIVDADIDPLVYVDARSMIPASLRYDTKPVVNEISLYNMDNFDDAADVAAVLAHEYGHHYTMYYFMQDEDVIRESGYYSLRGVEDFGHEVFFHTAQEYYDNYMWDIYELAANDYVQLMGSPNARQTQEYMDGMDMINKNITKPKSDYKAEYWNVFPQRNIYIPLADQVDGLRDYFYSFIEAQNEYETPVESFDFNIQFERHSVHGYHYYTVTWTMPVTDPDALYTLVCYDTSGNFYTAVRTVHGGEKAIAYVGEVVKDNGYQVYGWDDSITKADRIFRLYLLLPDGRMIASEPVYMDF